MVWLHSKTPHANTEGQHDMCLVLFAIAVLLSRVKAYYKKQQNPSYNSELT